MPIKMNPEEQKEVLDTISFLHFLPSEQRSELYKESRVFSIAKGESLFKEGEAGHSMYIVLAGCIEIFKQNKRISLLTTGDFLGEMAILDGKPRSAGAKGYEETLLFEINKSRFKEIIETNPPVVKALLVASSKRSRVDLDSIDEGYLELIQSEERYRTILETISDIVIQVDTNGNIIYVNLAIGQLGYDRDKLIGKPLSNIMVLPDFSNPDQQILTKRVRQRATTNLEVNFIIRSNKPGAELPETIPFLIDSHGLWDVKNDLVVDKNVSKVFKGTLCVAKNISNLKKQEMALRERKDELEALVKERTENLEKAIQNEVKANNAKSEFLARMSHELRTPMNSILGFAQLLDMKVKNVLDSTERKNIKHILNSGNHLLQLINEVLDLSKIESGEINYEKKGVLIGPIIKEILLQMEPLSKPHGISIDARDIIDSQYTILADGMRIKQILINLISNAIKYNRKKGSVIISAKENLEGMIEISIADTGVGIETKNQQKLFEPFSRFGDESKKIEGTGIGLAITERLVNLMEGTIKVESELGKGSCFTIIFPAA